MRYIEAPNHEVKNKVPKIFLGGGITNCKDWQNIIVSSDLFLKDRDVIVYNPRRTNFDISNPEMSSEQIRWEFQYLRECDILLFYFSEETLCPITLFELGAALERNFASEKPQRILVYCESGYKRAFDVQKQIQCIAEEWEASRSFGDTSNFYAYNCQDYDTWRRAILHYIKNF